MTDQGAKDKSTEQIYLTPPSKSHWSLWKWEQSELETVNNYKETVLSGHSRSDVHMYSHSGWDSMWKPVQFLPWRKVSSLPTWGATGKFYQLVEGKSTFSMIAAPSKSRKLQWKSTHSRIFSRHKLILTVLKGKKMDG